MAINDKPPAPPAPSAAQIDELTDADRRIRKATGMAGYAMFNSSMLFFCGGLTLLIWGLAPSPLITSGVLIGCGLVEWKGRQELLSLNPLGPKMLAINQLAILAFITIYCVWSMTGKSDLELEIAKHPEMVDILPPTLVHDLEKVAYELIIGGSVIFQGLMASAYHRGGKRLAEYLEATPPWVIEVQQKRRR